MTDALVHRGPDDSGFYEDDEISLGVRRLSIIDRDGGHQPLSNEDGTVWVVFNGEIYNHRQLQRETEGRHHRFRTRSDTEVLVHLWEDLGEGMVRSLRGMFAFVIYDSGQGLLFLARDRFGKKPLYYASQGTSFWFASELRALLSVPEISRDLNFSAASQYLTYFFNPLEESFIKGVYRLSPGCTLTYQISDHRATQGHYWDPVVAPKLDVDENSAMVLLEDRLTEAVRIRLESEVPMGALLSGGVDSSVVTAIAATLVDNLQTFHVEFEGATSEARFARLVADRVGAEHHEVQIGMDPMADFPEVARWIDEPVADASVFPTYYICREARRYVAVCLTGLGGDEIFRGYPWLAKNSAMDLWFRVPSAIRNASYQVARSAHWRLAALSTDLGKYEDLQYGRLNSREQCIARLEHYPPNLAGTMLRVPPPNRTLARLMDRVENDSDARDYLTVRSILPGDYLHKDDRLSMANSLELRSPLLDQVFALLCLRMPSHIKARNGISKYIFKKFAVRSLNLPRAAVYRRKVGFAIPLERFHRDMFSELETVNAELGFLDRNQISTFSSAKPSHENSGRMFAVLLLLHWCARNKVSMDSQAG